MGKIKVIIFDLGGVVFENGTHKAIKYLKEKYSFSDDLLEKIFYGKEALAFREGRFTPKEFWRFIDSILPKESRLTARNIRSIWYNFYIPPKGMLELLANLKRNYKLGILSGNIKERVDFLNEKYDFRKFFDFEVYSFDVGMNKPNLAFYQKALEKANVDAENCLYVDDHLEYVEPAKKLEMQTMLFRNFNQFLKELKQIGVKW